MSFFRHWGVALIPRLLVIYTLTLAAPAYSAADKPTLSIMVLGDSISAGYGIEMKSGWVNLLNEHLQAAASGSLPESSPSENSLAKKKYQVINASISGETTQGAALRLPALLEKYQPDITIIELGGNDGLRGFPITGIRNNLAKLVQLSQQSGSKVLLAGMRIPPNYGSRYTQQFYDSYTLTAQQYQIPLIPFLLDNIAIYPELMQSDGIHPTAQAQPRILENILPYLKELMATL